jgi:hypothetical protein
MVDRIDFSAGGWRPIEPTLPAPGDRVRGLQLDRAVAGSRPPRSPGVGFKSVTRASTQAWAFSGEAPPRHADPAARPVRAPAPAGARSSGDGDRELAVGVSAAEAVHLGALGTAGEEKKSRA